LNNKALLTVIRWLVIVAMPFFLGLGMIRGIILWDYPGFEYPRISPDMFGFTQEERLELARVNVEYLRRSEPASDVIYLLEDLRMPGTDRPLYNDSEISHMVDVKNVADAMTQVAYAAGGVVIVGLALLLIPAANRAYGWRTLFLAGLGTVIVLAVIALLILLGWQFFFVQFHELLFPPGTWTFAYTDSLIRLFPEQFWFDFGVIASVGTLALGLLVTLAGYVMSRRARRQLMGRR